MSESESESESGLPCDAIIPNNYSLRNSPTC